ncbi:restriction endonuclease subunit S [Vibrio fluvialis]
MSWPIVKIEDIFDVARGGSPRPIDAFITDDPDGVNWIMIGDTKSGEKYISTTAKRIRPEGVKKSRVVKEGDFLLTNSMSFGRPYILKTSGCIHDGWLVLSPKSDNIHTDYFYYYLGSQEIKNKLAGKAAGAVVKNLNKDIVKGLEIPLPPLDEQKRIAAILDKADAIRQKRKQAIELADEFLRSVFLEMFGDPVTNPKGWEVEKFGNVGSLDRGKSKHRPRNDPKLLGGLHPLVQTGDVANSKGYLRSYTSTYSDFGLAQSKKWPAGTLCITIAANIAKTGILTFDACFPDSVVGFTPNSKTTTEYVQAWISFLQKILEANAPESAQKNINLAILRDLNIPVPPVSEQNKFTMIVEKVNSVLNRTRASKDSNEQLFDSLSQKAFSGQL